MTILSQSKIILLSFIIKMSYIKKSPHKRLGMNDKSHEEIILRVSQYFELEKAIKQRQNLQKVVERTAAATGASRKIVSLIKAEEDVKNWKCSSGDILQQNRDMAVPPKFCSLKRHVVCNMLLKKTSLHTFSSV